VRSAGETYAPVALGEPTFGDEEIEAVRQVLASGWVAGQGPANRSLESAFAAFCQTEHAVAVNNCTAALHLALLALGVGVGDEVIVADYTYPATGHSVLFTGAQPVFADVLPDTWCVDPSAVEAAITSRTVGVIAVDVAGQCADYAELRAITERAGLFLVEDGACSIGATYHGKPSGHPDLSDIAAFSFHGRKGITCGEGGILATASADHAAFMRKRASFGVESALVRQGADVLPIPVFDVLGYNYKLSDISAAIAHAQLTKIESLLERRRSAASRYTELLAECDAVTTPVVGADREHTWQSYILTLAPGIDRGAVAMDLRARGVGANIGTYASHREPVYGETGRCPVAADIFERHLAIPMHANLVDSQIEFVVENVKSAIDANLAHQ
jgi:dTDP-4-amino-4,6-dideoxygalactose transaminase